MESIDQDYDNFIMGIASDRQLTLPSSPDINDVVGAPQLNPRVGHEFQVEVPLMVNESERLQLLMNPADSEPVHDNSHPFVFSLSIPTIWVKDSGDNDGTNNGIVPAEADDARKSSVSDNGTELGPTTFQSAIATDKKGGRSGKSKNYAMAPGTLSDSWSDSDVKSFVLGLFIFGKNFIQIKNFLENKAMGDILSFYYGKFYKSDEYRRWTYCKKMKGKKCMTGHKLFTGRRHHELLSRLIPHVSQESQDTLEQISKSYVEGRTSLEEYISSLKSIVGLGVLVEAVGIGKGKEDLTSLSVEPDKNNRVLSIPTGKAWSSLGLSDIVNFLTGGVRLSKAKSNDLFWEAVWPRLLARGWHSEQPNHKQGYVGCKDFLVFLIPGVTKFSRRKLVKGDHYFDSVSDVLSKVAAEPNLLELEGEEGKVGSCNDEETEKGVTEDDQSDYHRHCYLKPRVSTSNTDPVKFIVVDTSLAHGGKSSDLRKLESISGNPVGKVEVHSAVIMHNKGDKHNRKSNHSKGSLDSKKLTMFTVVDTSFPDEGKNSSKVRELGYPLVELEEASMINGIARENDRSSSDDNSSIETEATLPICGKKIISNVDWEKGTRDRDTPKEAYGKPDDNANKIAESCQNQKIYVSDGNQLKRTIKHQFCRRPRSGHSNLAVHPIKRRRLTACVKSETSRILESSKLGAPCFPDANKNAGNPVSNEQDVSLVPFSAEESAQENNEGSILNRVSLDKGICCDKVEKCDSQPPVNFNSPQVPPKSEDGETMPAMEQDEQWQKPNDIISRSDVEKPLTHSSDVGSKEQQPDMVPRRQSTRNRPLTVRALECIANEFLHVKSRQKRKGPQTPKDSLSTCRRDRAGGKTILHRHSPGHETAVSTEEKHLNGDLGVKENTSKPLE